MGGDPLDFITYIRENRDDFIDKLNQHLELTIVAVLLGILIALPLAVLVSRVDVLAKPVVWLAGAGQTIPSLAVLALMLPYLGTGFRPSVFALTIRAILPIFLNAYIGIRNVDRAAIDAARGMGTNGAQLLFLVELPLASPVLYAGIQTATVQTIATATLAAYIGGGGLGDFILQGLAMLDFEVLLAGAVPVALLAMLTEIAMSRARRLVVPVGLRVAAR